MNREEIRAEFIKCDADGDGQLNEEELRNLLVAIGARVGMDDQTIMRALIRFDLDLSGKVDFKEFVAVSALLGL